MTQEVIEQLPCFDLYQKGVITKKEYKRRLKRAKRYGKNRKKELKRRAKKGE